MRLRFLSCLALLAAATLAHADTYRFDFDTNNPELCSLFPNECQFSLASWTLSSTPDSYTATTATYNDVVITGITGELYGEASMTLDYAKPGEIIIGNSSNSFPPFEYADTIYVGGYPGTSFFFSGPTSSLTYVQGTYPSDIYFSYDYSTNSGPLTITDLSASAVPEPSTFALLGTGVLGAASVLRRRRTSLFA